MRRKNIICDVGFNTAWRWGVLLLGPQDIDVAIVRWKR